MKKRYKAIFGNPPYSIRSERGSTSPELLWDKFSQTSIDSAEEVYYVTPYIWNGRVKKFINANDNKIRKIDLTAADDFNVGSTICYWNNHKSDKKEIHTADKVIEINKLSDIEYLPYDLDNTLSIHMKCWERQGMNFESGYNLKSYTYKNLISNVETDEYKYPAFKGSKENFYINEEGLEKYGKELFYTPKIMIGIYRYNTPIFDRVGYYATTENSCLLLDTMDNLEIRYKQLKSKFAKFYYKTARQKQSNTTAMYIYNKALRLFPAIPLSITDDKEIYEWLGLDDNEIKIVEKYAKIVEGMDERRELKAKNKGKNYDLI